MLARRSGAIGLAIGLIFVAASVAAAGEGAGGQAATRPVQVPVVIFQDDFEAGWKAAWQRDEGIEIVEAGGKKVCRIESDGRGKWLTMGLPSERLGSRRLEIFCRYRLTGLKVGKSRRAGVKMEITHTDQSLNKGQRGYRSAAFEPSEDVSLWRELRFIRDFPRKLSGAEIGFGFDEAAGVLLIDDVRVTARPQSLEEVKGYKRPKRGKLIFEDNFDTDLSNWVHEGVGTAEVKDGRLEVYVTPDHAETRGQILWLKKKLPAEIIVEMVVKLIAPRYEQNITCNLLFFLSTTRRGGNLLGTIAERDGGYGAYISKRGIVPCYTVTWYRVNDPFFVIVRRNPGWGELARNFPAVPTAGHDYKIEIEKRGNEIVLFENGVAILLAKDKQPPLGGGYFGLRSWHAKASYDYVRIYEVAREAK